MKENRELVRMLSLITQLGFSMMVPIFMCVFIGVVVEDKWGISLVLPLMILGIAAGIRNCFILLKKVKKD